MELSSESEEDEDESEDDDLATFSSTVDFLSSMASTFASLNSVLSFCPQSPRAKGLAIFDEMGLASSASRRTCARGFQSPLAPPGRSNMRCTLPMALVIIFLVIGWRVGCTLMVPASILASMFSVVGLHILTFASGVGSGRVKVNVA